MRRFEAVLLIDPLNGPARLNLGSTWFRMGRYDEAARAYQAVLDVSPDDPDAKAGLWAARLQQAGYSEEAQAAVRAEIEAWRAGNSRSLSRRLAAYRGFDLLHDKAQARLLLLKLLSVDLEGDAREEIAQETFEAALGEQDPVARRRVVDAFLAKFPDSVYRQLLYQYHLSWVARVRGPKEFRREARRLLRRDPDNRTLNFVAGYWSIDFGVDLDWAVARVRRALDHLDHPDVREKLPYVTVERWTRMLSEARGRYEDTLGWGLFQLGHIEEAGSRFERARALLPRDHRSAYHHGRWLEAAGREREALEAYLVAVETGTLIADAPVALRRLAIAQGVIDRDARDEWRAFANREGVATFTDVTEEAGLKGVVGGRVAWGDYDGDGAEDLLVDGQRLFHNDGHGRFVETTAEAGLGANPGGNGGIWADIDNDGRLDLFTMGSGRPDVAGSSGRMWMNQGDGTFLERAAMLPAGLTHGAPTEGAGWGDFDRDGFVDLYLANYELPFDRAVSLGICTPDHLLRNVEGRRFEDVTTAAGIVSAEPMCGRGVAWADYDRDGFPDILVTNYRLDPNFLWRNLGNGTFENVARAVGVEGEEQEGAFGHSIGAEWADVNRDGAPDLFIANLAHPRYIGYSDLSQLLINSGGPSPRFTDQFDEAGFAFNETTSEPSWGDYDNDGDLDLFLTSVYRGSRSTLYRNDGAGHFTDVTWLAGAGVENGWGAAYADIDGDGDLDLVVGSGDGIRLLRNDGTANHWLHVRAVGTSSNRSAIGARVTVTAGALRQTAEVQGGKGTGNQHSLPLEFGLGTWDQPVTVEVWFPSGRIRHLKGVEADRLLTVTEP
ncbi:MAG: VCBS repeat-containing protein [Nitrospirae bacterium]|nr:VCBS repeat-containing protein [Nitrospirota bacterium]